MQSTGEKMNDESILRTVTRRHFFRDCQVGLGSLALASLLSRESLRAAPARGPSDQPLAPRGLHHPARARNVIFLFMAGGPSQLELFDYKPKLQEMDGQVIPDEYIKGKRFAFLKGKPKLVGTRRKFTKHGDCGMELGETLPHLGTIADDITLIKSMKTDVFNHGPAKLF